MYGPVPQQTKASGNNDGYERNQNQPKNKGPGLRTGLLPQLLDFLFQLSLPFLGTLREWRLQTLRRCGPSPARRTWGFLLVFSNSCSAAAFAVALVKWQRLSFNKG
jgi:hypothetical protein